MFKQLALLALCFAFVPNLAHAACSHANLTRCLDSVCAINISTNPAARCQYCGTSNAGTPSSGGMKSVSAGTTTKYNISDKELKSAPTDPGERYAWATEKCIERVNGCSPDDVSDIYDKLIEQSCTAAGISTQMANLAARAAREKTFSVCSSEISTCITADTRCASDFRECTADADFDKFFSACAADATGCTNHISKIRSETLSTRNSAIQSADANVRAIAAAYAAARDESMSTAHALCDKNAGFDACVAQMCAERMANQCTVGHDDEKSMATNLCEYYKIACATLK